MPGKTKYFHKPVCRRELTALIRIAAAEEAAFFARNPHLAAPYRRRLRAIALCQGAAAQYLGRGHGVGDFDIHFFYRQNPTKPRLARTVKRMMSPVGAFPRIQLDFIRTVIPAWLCTDHPRDPTGLLRRFLELAPTANAYHLAKQPVIGLYPRSLFADGIWPIGAA